MDIAGELYDKYADEISREAVSNERYLKLKMQKAAAVKPLLQPFHFTSKYLLQIPETSGAFPLCPVHEAAFAENRIPVDYSPLQKPVHFR